MKTISITSGKGGVGKSIVAANLGLALASRGKRVLLFDADLGLANIDILFGLTCKHTLYDVLDSGKPISEVLVEAPYGMKILPSRSGILELERLSPAQLGEIARGLEEVSGQFDVLLLDTGAGLTDNVLFFNASADEILLVTTPEPTALTDAYALIKILSTNHGVKSVVVLVNLAQTIDEGFSVFKRLERVCGNYLDTALVYGGYLLADSAVPLAVRERKPLVLADPENVVSRQIHALASRYEEIFTRPMASFQSDFWSRVLQQQSKRGQPKAPH